MKRFGYDKFRQRFGRIVKPLLGSLAIVCLFAAISTAPVTSNAVTSNDTELPDGESPFVQGQLIVQVEGPEAAEQIADRFPGYSLTPVKLLSKRMNIWLYEYSTTNLKMTDQVGLLEAVRRDADVVLAQFNHYVTQRQTIPNDASFGLQWSKHNTGQSGGTVDADIDAPEAWDVITGDTTINGDQIVVAIIDGGCDLNHNDIDFFKNTLEIPNNGVDDDGNGYVDDYDGWNAYNSTGNVGNDSHGTHVAGIAAAIGNNGIGVAGVNWGVKVMPIAGSSTNEAVVVEAYGYVLEMRTTYNETNGAAGAFVVSANSSFGVDYGNPASYPIWCATYDSMGAAGIINAAATANIGMDIDINGDVPTACASDYLISVTNTTRYDSRNSGAAWGLTTIDLGAPGTSVYSTLPGSSYGSNTGTSMATPQVTGAVAFLYSAACATMLNDMWADPGAIALFMKQAILDGTDPNASLAGITVSGGRLNLNGSLQLVLAYPCGLNISHTPLTDTKDDVNPIEVVANITSATAIDTDSTLVYYSTDGGSLFTPVLMSDYGAGEFHGFIPAQSPGAIIDYYIFARDIGGDRDSTDTYSFRIIDYNVLVSPPTAYGFGPAEDIVSYVISVTNDGILTDDIALSYSGNFWSVSTWDAPGSIQITSTGNLLPDESVDVLVKVSVPISIYGDQDSVEIVATSVGNSSYFASASLITTSVGVPLTLPVVEEFVSTTIDPTIWQLASSGILVQDLGLNEPSAPYSLNLNGTPSGADTLMSMVIDLRAYSGVIVRYSYQQTGGSESPDSNDDLFIEYQDSLGGWVLISKHLGGDPDMTTFAEVEYVLPGDAYHSNFHFRIRNLATPGPYDDWFVDDVYIGTPYLCGDVNNDGSGPDVLDLTYLVDYLFGGGAAPPVLDAANIDGIGGIDIIDLTYLVDYLFAGGPEPICP